MDVHMKPDDMNQLSYYGATDPGRCRENNEDAYLLEMKGKCIIAAVADGIGGNEGGEIASYLACRCISGHLNDTPAQDLGMEALKQAVIYANNAIVSQQQNPRLCSMGCALTAVLFDMEQGLGHMCHVGDTRLYRYRDGDLAVLSRDHSAAGNMAENGIPPRQGDTHGPLRNMLSRFLGNSRLFPGTDYTMDLSFPLESETRYLICSDGLYDMVSPAGISDVLAREDDPGEAVRRLIRMACLAGGKDNVTAVILEQP